MRENDIRTLPDGSHFYFKGFKWIALDNNVDGGVLAVMASSWNGERYRFDEDYCNNYAESSLRKKLRDELLPVLGEEPGRRKREVQNSMRRSDCAFPCGRCLCNHCANNVETIDNCTGEAKEPCFACDECRWYDGDTKHKDMWRQECGEYIVTNEHAERLRRKLKLITGGHTS